MKNWWLKIYILFITGLTFRIIINYYSNTDLFLDIINMFAFATLFSLPKISMLSNNVDNNLLNNYRDDNTDLLRKSAKKSEINFSNKCKCKIYWNLFEKNKNNYKNYKAFELLWDSKKEITKEMNYRISMELRNKIRTWQVQKRTLLWFLGRR